GVQGFGGFEVSPERFFDDDATPVPVFSGEIRFAETFDDRGSERRRSREIEEMVFAAAVGDKFFETFRDAAIRVVLIELACNVVKAGCELAPLVVVELLCFL